MWYHFLKFCIVGGVGVTLDFALTWLFKEKVRLNKYLANSLGFFCAQSFNYVFNRLWTFQGTSGDALLQYVKFLGIAGTGLIINNMVIYLMHEKLHLNFYFSKLFSMTFVTFWNFFMNYLFNF